MSSLADELLLLNQAARDLQTTRYLTVASFVALCYDILITLPEFVALFRISDICVLNDFTISLIWKASWSSGKILFFATRYPIVLEAIVWLIYTLDFNATPRFCLIVTFLDAWATLAFIIPVQIIVVLRTIALWDRKRMVIGILIFAMAAADIVMTVSIGLVSKSVVYQPNPLVQPLFGCNSGLETLNVDKTIPAWAALMAFDTTIFIFTLIRAIEKLRYGRSTLLTVLVRDGFLYYTIMLAASAANLVIYVVLPADRRGLVASLLPVLRGSMAIIGGRIVLNVRGVLTGNDHASHLSSMSFQAPPSKATSTGETVFSDSPPTILISPTSMRAQTQTISTFQSSATSTWVHNA